MKRILLIIIGMMLIAVSAVTAAEDSAKAPDTIKIPEAPYYKTLDEAMKAHDDGRNILVDFYADW